MKTTIFALVASLSIAFVAPGIVSADVGANTDNKNVTAPKGPTGNVPGDADKHSKVPTGKVPNGKVPVGKTPANNDAHGKNMPGKNAKLDCKSPKLDAKMKQMCDAQHGAKRS